MAQQTMEKLEEEYKLYKEAQIAIIENKVKEYAIKDRSIIKLGLPEIEKRLDKIVNDMAKASVGGKTRVKRVVVGWDS